MWRESGFTKRWYGSIALASTPHIPASNRPGLDVGPVIPLAEKATETGDVEEVYRLLTAELHTELTRRLDQVTRLAAKDAPVPAARAHVEAVLGFQVYANHVCEALHTEPHGERSHG